MVVVDLQCAKCESVAARLRDDFCIQTLAIEANVADPASIQAVVKRVLDHFGHIYNTDFSLRGGSQRVHDGYFSV